MPPPRRAPNARRAGPWKHGAIPVVGLVGGIGAGKSAVAEALAGRGAAVIDADAVGHALLEQTPAREQVLARFGVEILDHSTTPPRIDRRALGRIVFAEPGSLRALERILHPRMRRTFEKAIARQVRGGRSRAIVLDAAVLFEAGWHDLCDLVVFVDAPPEQRQARLAAARGWSVGTWTAREQSQAPLGPKRDRADLVLDNSGDPDRLSAEIERLWTRLTERPRVRAPRPGGSPPGPIDPHS